MFGIGMTELMVILIIGLVVIGPKKLPGLARSLGKSLAEFRRASDDMRREFLDVAETARVDPPELDPKPEVETDTQSDTEPGTQPDTQPDARPKADDGG
jgi:Tat protein translocase TatB subunit